MYGFPTLSHTWTSFFTANPKESVSEDDRQSLCSCKASHKLARVIHAHHNFNVHFDDLPRIADDHHSTRETLGSARRYGEFHSALHCQFISMRTLLIPVPIVWQSNKEISRGTAKWSRTSWGEIGGSCKYSMLSSIHTDGGRFISAMDATWCEWNETNKKCSIIDFYNL